MVTKKISRRKALAIGGLAVAGGLAGLVNHFSGESQQAGTNKSDSSIPSTGLPDYKVLDAYIDSDGRKILQIQLDKDKSNRTFYEITDYSHSREFSNLRTSVGRGRLKSSEPDPLFGYRYDGKYGMYSSSSGTGMESIKRIYDAEVAQGRQFKDLTEIDPVVRLEDMEYDRKHQIAGFELQTRDSKVHLTAHLQLVQNMQQVLTLNST